MYLIPMNRQIVWRWSHVRTLKYTEVMVRNRKTRDCIMQKYFASMLALVFLVESLVFSSVIDTFEEDFM